MESIFTVDAKWCLYVNIKGSPPWVDKDVQHEPQPKAGLYPIKVMVSTWCDCKSMMHCEVLSRYNVLKIDLYCQRLDRMAANIAGEGQNYCTIRFLHDSARPLTIRVTRQKLHFG
ncbi:hypothetical protein Y032_0013g2051 [Ancylostoma ceylanicum]|uniref:Uncharacterized protein n=1 Tax=Ancylostoma ceylanicum TaxID=53326 RepID=A0A016VBP4_9BILA|nr:hypothetical protein Y032_0013g2051 [Ancylostoma ceylanicum]